MKKTAVLILFAMTSITMAACGSRRDSQQSSAETQSTASAADQTQESSQETPEDTGTQGQEENTSDSTDSQSARDLETDAASAVQKDQTAESTGSGSSNILIAYFTVPETDGVDTVAGASRISVDGEVLGNNQYVAQLIQQETGGDLFAIETVQEYPGIHDELLNFAYNELSENARPELATQIQGLDGYDTIFLGYPNWNADLPMPLYTFLESYDFSGKTIIPFTTHGGSGFSGTIQTIEELQPDAVVVEDGLSISRNSVPDAQSSVTEWISGLDL